MALNCQLNIQTLTWPKTSACCMHEGITNDYYLQLFLMNTIMSESARAVSQKIAAKNVQSKIHPIWIQFLYQLPPRLVDSFSPSKH